jgi:hypothetical protein
MLWVLAVELGWVSLLLFWSRQRALNDDGEADSWAAPATAAVAAAAADDSPAPQVTMERSASQEMRVLLVSLQPVGPAFCHVLSLRLSQPNSLMQMLIDWRRVQVVRVHGAILHIFPIQLP